MDEYLEQIIFNLNTLVADGKYKEGYNMCNRYLEKFPNNRSLRAVKSKIEEEVLIENNKIIERELGKLEEIFEQKKYAEVLVALKKLRKLNPNHKKVNQWYAKSQKLYLKQVDEMSRGFKYAQMKRLENFLEKAPEMLMDEIFKLEKENPGSKEVGEIAAEMRDRLIEKMIKEKSDLLYSEKFEAIASFMQKLKVIDPSNKRITELEPLVKGWRFAHQSNKKLEFIYKGKSHLDTLIKLGKIDKAYQVAGEILELEPDSKRLQKIFRRVQGLFYDFCKERSVELIERDYVILKKEFESNPDAFQVL